MRHALLGQRRLHVVAQARAHRVGHGHVGHQAGAEEALVAREGAVDELVHHHEGARRQVGAQATHGRQREHIGRAQYLQGRHIGAVIHFRRRDAVAAAVARQEGQLSVA